MVKVAQCCFAVDSEHFELYFPRKQISSSLMFNYCNLSLFGETTELLSFVMIFSHSFTFLCHSNRAVRADDIGKESSTSNGRYYPIWLIRLVQVHVAWQSERSQTPFSSSQAHSMQCQHDSDREIRTLILSMSPFLLPLFLFSIVDLLVPESL